MAHAWSLIREGSNKVMEGLGTKGAAGRVDIGSSAIVIKTMLK